MKLKRLFFVLGLLFCFQAVSAQAYMVLRKNGTTRRYEYRVGNYLVYKQKGELDYFTDRITDFADSTVVLENNIITLDQIEIVNVSNAFSNRSPLLRSAEDVLPVAGYGLLAIDLFNNSVLEGNPFTFDTGTTATSAALVLTGYGLRWMRRKKVDLTNPKFEAFIIGRF